MQLQPLVAACARQAGGGSHRCSAEAGGWFGGVVGDSKRVWGAKKACDRIDYSNGAQVAISSAGPAETGMQY